MRELTELSNYLSVIPDNTFNETVLKETFPALYPILLKSKVIQITSPATVVLCKDCDSDHFTNVFKIRDKYFTKCEYNEYASIRYVMQEELISHRFNLSNFLTWLAKELRLQEETKIISDMTWYLGSAKGKDIYFIKSAHIEETLNCADKIRSDDKLIIWLGETPMVGFVRHNLLSLRSILGITGNNMTAKLTQRSLQTLKKTIPDKDSIVLDTHILISSNKIWLHKKGMEFEKEINLKRNDCFRIVRYLYDTRNSGTYLKAVELSDKLGIKPTNAIQTRIAEVNKICRENNLKDIIVSHVNNTWVLNPKLDCFQTSPK